jgi:NAD(P)-dependent dehydrogenase (short-subunit alcohol dehydrogenase family)
MRQLRENKNSGYTNSMTRGIFIAGNESALSRAIEAETVKRVEHYAAAFIPNRFSTHAAPPKIAAEIEKARILIEWNPSSPLSARTLILAAGNRLDAIDDAILICSPPSLRLSAIDLPLSDVEIMINDQIKGWFFLVKELAAVMSEQGRGTLALVYPDYGSLTAKDESADLLGPSALASFRAFTAGLLTGAGGDPYITNAFSISDSGAEDAFAAFIYKHIDEAVKRSSGKLYKYGKFNFFK